MKIAIVGAAGRMGKKLIELAQDAGLEVAYKVDVAEEYGKTWGAGCEGVIDFSYHTGVPAAIAKAAALRSVATTSTVGRSAANVTAMAPLPVPKSRTRTGRVSARPRRR